MHFKADARSSRALFKCVVMATGHWPAFLGGKMKKISISIVLVLFVQILYSQSNFVLKVPFKSNYLISRTYGYYENSSTKTMELHEGIDFVVQTGTDVYPAYEGTITEVSYDYYLGNYITILHPNGFKTRYCNLKSMKKLKGETVTKKDIIATSGNTGESDSPHLCFRLYDSNDVPINPTKYFKKLPKPTTPPNQEEYASELSNIEK